MKNKGFTLIELLATIIVLAIIGLIVYPTLNNVIQGNKEKLYNKQIEELVRHANTWIIGNIDKIGDRDSYLLSFDEMYKYGLIQNNTIKNPMTNQDLQGCMVLSRGESGYIASYSEECAKKTLGKTCTYNGELVKGATFVDGQYSYIYGIDTIFTPEDDYTDQIEIEIDGWRVELTDRESTDPVTTELCNSINDKSIVSMSNMFASSQAISIDLSSFDTSNVTDMSGMFGLIQATTLDLSSFDTSKVTNMSWMFAGDNIENLDISNFDTSNVTDMGLMFGAYQGNEVNLSNFNTSKVICMNEMFRASQFSTLDLSSFDTSNVIYMKQMFDESQATTGYAKTQADADKFNASSNKPSTLTFIVK